MSVAKKSSTLSAQSVWPIDRVKDHAVKIGSGVTPSGGSAGYLDAGVPLLRSQNVHFDGLRLDDVAYIANETHDEMRGSKLRCRDVLLNITGASIGRCAFVPDDFGEGNVNQHVCIIRTSPRLNHKFLTYCLSAPWGQDQIFSSFTGASRQGLGQRDLGSIQVPFPPLPEQHRIAAYLDASCAAIDAAVTAKRSQLETLDALRKSITLQTVTKGLDPNVLMRETGIDWIPEIPAHWETTKLTSLFWFRKGSRASDITQKYIAEYPGEFPVFSGQTENGGLMGSIDSFEFNFDSPVIFVTTVGAKAMSTRLVSGKFSVSQNCALVIPWHRKTRVEYFEPTIQELFDFERRSIALIMQPSLRFKDMKKFRLPLPPETEQAAICEHLEEKRGELKQVANSIEAQIATLTAYRKSLIHECVTGQRRITDADLRKMSAASILPADASLEGGKH
jgi:type I restriction enzyme S subunit